MDGLIISLVEGLNFYRFVIGSGLIQGTVAIRRTDAIRGTAAFRGTATWVFWMSQNSNKFIFFWVDKRTNLYSGNLQKTRGINLKTMTDLYGQFCWQDWDGLRNLKLYKTDYEIRHWTDIITTDYDANKRLFYFFLFHFKSLSWGKSNFWIV